MVQHKAVATTAKGTVAEIDVTTREPGADEVQFKVQYATLIPLDVYSADHGAFVQGYPTILGFAAAGVITAAGSSVKHLAKGDKVAAFTYQSSEVRALQQYITNSASVCGKVPENVPLEEAVLYADNFVCAVYTVADSLNLIPTPPKLIGAPSPHHPNVPILVWGGGSSSGQYLIQVLKLAGYQNIITTASSLHHVFLKGLGAAHTVDYKDKDVVEQIRKLSGGDGVAYAIDPIATEDTVTSVRNAVRDDAAVAIFVPYKPGRNASVGDSGDNLVIDIPPEVKNKFPNPSKVVGVRTFLYQQNPGLKDTVMPELFPELLAANALTPNRPVFFDRGSFKERTEAALDILRTNKIAGGKAVVKVVQ